MSDLKQPTVEPPAAEPPAIPAQRSPSQSDEPSEPSEPKVRKSKVKPSALREHAQRLVVRRALYCQVPGINRVRAEAIVQAYPTVSALMHADVNALAAIPIKKSPLGMELAVALKRVFE